MKLVIDQINDLLLRLNTIEARLTGLEFHEDDEKYWTEAETLLHKYNAEGLRLENFILQKKLQMAALRDKATSSSAGSP